MGTKDSDDPMDLGPFFQSYVLQNPFSSLMVTPKKEDKGKCNAHKPKSTTPTMPSTPHDTKRRVPVLPPASENGRIKPPVVDIALVDTPKAHIGSNFHFAMMLRHFKVSDIHRDIQKWLWDEYRYVKEYAGQLPQAELLTTVQKQFPELTSSVLSRVMKFTFPTCPKTLNKLGTFYTGLVRRPKVEDYHNVDALRAADHVHSTSCSVDVAASVYQVSEAVVASIHFWRNFPATSLHSLLRVPNTGETCDDNSIDSATCHQTADASDSDISDSPSRLSQHKPQYVCQELHFRGTNGVSGVANGNSNTDHCMDSWTGGDGPADSTDSRGSTASNQSQTRPKRRRSSSGGADVPEKRIKPENGTGEWCIRLTHVNDEEPCHVEPCHVAVKEEHIDPAYNDDITASTQSSERRTTDSRLACPTVSSYRGDLSRDRISATASCARQQNNSFAISSSAVSEPGNSRSSTINQTSAFGMVSSCTDVATVDVTSSMSPRETIHRHTDDGASLLQSHQMLQRRVEDTQCHLLEQQEDNARLTRELAAAKRRIQLLDQSLEARNTQLTQLAEEFFAFGDKFQQLSRHFQLALIGITDHGDGAK